MRTRSFPSGVDRWRGRHVLVNIAMTVGCMVVLGGCFFQSIVGWVGDDGSATFSANLEVGFCNFDTTVPQFYGCTYTIRDDDGFLVDIVSSFDLVSELGFFGAIIDPLVLQVPDDATNVVATFNNAGSDEPLVVTETTSFPVTPGVTVESEADTKFLILELPDAAAMALPPGRSDINFSLDFDVSDLNLFVKPMFTAAVEHAGVDYYVPIFPCVTDFALIPEARIPVGTDFQFLNPEFAPLRDGAAGFACDQKTYVFDVVAMCNGVAATIDMNTNGGLGTGTAGADVILGTPGNDTINGLGGDDVICAESGDDTVMGGPGRDLIRGGPGIDNIVGGDGNDRLLGGIGNDTIDGGPGDDFIGGFGGADTITGGDGDETIFGGFGADIIDGGPGSDTIRGLIGDDMIDGGEGDDHLFGDRGNDTINGGAGNDVIQGGNAADVISGGDGNDDLAGGKADDALDGGPGADVCVGNLHFVADTATNCEAEFGIP